MRIKRSVFFLYLGSFVLIIKTIFSSSRIVPYTDFTDQMISLAGILLLITSILMKKYKIKTLFFYVVIVGLTFYNSVVTGNNALVMTVITCLAARSCDIEKYINFIFHVECIVFGLHTICAVFFSLFGIINITQNIGGTMRYNFGMQHPNSFAALAFNILIMLIWVKWDEIRTRHIFMMTIVVFIIFVFCKTRTNLLTMLAVICLLVFRKFGKNFDKIIERIAFIIIPLLSILMTVFILLYFTGNEVIMILDNILNARILLGAYAFSIYRFTVFGQNVSTLYTEIAWDPTWKLNAFTFDCLYSYMLINQGIIWLIILIILFAKLAMKKNARDNVSIISWALYGLTEVQGLNGFSCTPILLLTRLFRKDEGKYD